MWGGGGVGHLRIVNLNREIFSKIPRIAQRSTIKAIVLLYRIVPYRDGDKVLCSVICYSVLLHGSYSVYETDSPSVTV